MYKSQYFNSTFEKTRFEKMADIVVRELAVVHIQPISDVIGGGGGGRGGKKQMQ